MFLPFPCVGVKGLQRRLCEGAGAAPHWFQKVPAATGQGPAPQQLEGRAVWCWAIPFSFTRTQNLKDCKMKSW